MACRTKKPLLPAAMKIELIDRLVRLRPEDHRSHQFRQPEVGAATGGCGRSVCRHPQAPGVRYPVLVPNLQGYERARAVGATEIAVFTAASEAFNRKNTNASIDESIERFMPVMRARAAPTACACAATSPPCSAALIQGEVPLADVVRVAKRLHELGCYEISLGDTIGVGTPAKARAMLRAVAQEVPMDALAVHFHDTYGQALANILACLEEGVRVVDSSVSGTGGCPYAKGATGNVATEDVVYMLHGMGIETGVDLPLLVETGWWLARQLGHRAVATAALAGPD